MSLGHEIVLLAPYHNTTCMIIKDAIGRISTDMKLKIPLQKKSFVFSFEAKLAHSKLRPEYVDKSNEFPGVVFFTVEVAIKSAWYCK